MGNKKEIKYYLKMVDNLEFRLKGEDKETFAWLIYGYNQCAKLLNETGKQVKKQEEAINKAIDYIQNHQLVFRDHTIEEIDEWFNQFYIDILDILKKKEKNDE